MQRQLQRISKRLRVLPNSQLHRRVGPTSLNEIGFNICVREPPRVFHSARTNAAGGFVHFQKTSSPPSDTGLYGHVNCQSCLSQWTLSCSDRFCEPLRRVVESLRRRDRSLLRHLDSWTSSVQRFVAYMAGRKPSSLRRRHRVGRIDLHGNTHEIRT
jgi:hypothetical protein